MRKWVVFSGLPNCPARREDMDASIEKDATTMVDKELGMKSRLHRRDSPADDASSAKISVKKSSRVKTLATEVRSRIATDRQGNQ